MTGRGRWNEGEGGVMMKGGDGEERWDEGRSMMRVRGDGIRGREVGMRRM